MAAAIHAASISSVSHNTTTKSSFPVLSVMVGIPAGLLYIATHVVIPFLQRTFPVPIEVSFFISAGFLVFVPIFLASIILGRKESGERNFQAFSQRMRLQPMRLADWGYTIGAFMIVMGLSAALMNAGAYIPSLNTSLPFMDNMPLHPENYWILAVWFPFFFFNIFGEELWWRGYLLPKLELSTAKHAWLLNGVCWAVFHIGMGWSTIFLALPMLFILPGVAQIRKNTTIAVILHALFGALGILSQAFGTGQ